MALYRCLIRGENFPGALFGLSTLTGFYRTRFVNARSPQEAERSTLAKLKREPKLQRPPDLVLNAEPRVYFEEIVKMPARSRRRPNSGFVFFEMGT